MRALKSLLLLAPLTLAAFTGCQEEEFITLFDEGGRSWSLISHDIENSGTFMPLDSANRKDGFLLYFKRTSGETQRPAGKLAAATCYDDAMDQNLDSTSCNSGFTCRCFDYTFNEDTMTWQEYAIDGVPLYEPEEGQASPGDVITIFLTASESISDTYIFRPLAPQLFQSDGLESRYQFQEKAATLFDKTGCAEACGI
ncbi:MAG: hypothetical protein H6710_00995 [Myxococcales bacterium]|nr:hypothetical protein [Myxococcales bacterium]MCB9703014.1 hypothetical protein [Myxococcales bacterium]